MIRLLQPTDREAALAYGYRHERENMFLIGSLSRAGGTPFDDNIYIGGWKEGVLCGIGTYFGRFKSLVVHAQENAVLQEITDAFVELNVAIEWIPALKRFALPTTQRLRERRGQEPKQVREETFFLLRKEDFTDHSTPEVRQATPADVDEVLALEALADGEEGSTVAITDGDRRRIVPEYEFLLRKDGILVSTAATQAVSEHYAQLGGIATRPDRRGKGFAKQTVSAACRYWIERGKDILLFCKNDNAPAIAVYTAIGFRPIDEFRVIRY